MGKPSLKSKSDSKMSIKKVKQSTVSQVSEIKVRLKTAIPLCMKEADSNLDQDKATEHIFDIKVKVETAGGKSDCTNIMTKGLSGIDIFNPNFADVVKTSQFKNEI